jgi:F-type H+-transporting ATPase subunit delta
MIVGSVARRYAKAAFAVADQQGVLEQTAAELQALRALALDPQVADTLANPLFSSTARAAMARTIADTLALSPTTRNFLCLLADHRRLDHLAAITTQFERLLDQRLKRVRATVSSALPLSEAQRQSIVATFERQLRRTVLADYRVDPALLGGVVVDVEGTVYDGSVRTQLRTLAHSIAGGQSLN